MTSLIVHPERPPQCVCGDEPEPYCEFDGYSYMAIGLIESSELMKDHFTQAMERMRESIRSTFEVFAGLPIPVLDDLRAPPKPPRPTDAASALEAKRISDESRRRRLESLHGRKRGPSTISPTRHRGTR